eukprot:COSAG04_NODE_3762_length_2553_cov_1.007746_3_plen_79_part_00
MPAVTPDGRGVSADEHMKLGMGLRADEALADGTATLLQCPGGVPFTHPEFAIMCAKTGLSEGVCSWFAPCRRHRSAVL